MITEASTGWLIHKRNVAEHAMLLTLLTADRGLVRVRMQGRRLLKKNGMLQAFTPLWWLVDVRVYGTYVREIESVSVTLPLRGAVLCAGLYLNELLYHLLPLNQMEPELFVDYEKTLHALPHASNLLGLETLLRRFEWRLLAISGVLVSFTHVYGAAELIQADRYYVFRPGSGFILAEVGFLGAHVLAIARNELDCPAVLKSAKRIMRAAIDHVLNGVPLHTRRIYRAVVNS